MTGTMRTTMLLLLSLLARTAVALGGQDLLRDERIDVDFKNASGLVVVFLSAKCPCSKSHVEPLKKMASDYPKFKFVAVHANVDEPLDEARAYFGQMKLSFPIIEDGDQALAQRFGASRTPHAFVLTKGDQTVYRGGVSDSHDGVHAKVWPLKEALDDITAGRPVRRAEARALGCAISRGRRAKI